MFTCLFTYACTHGTSVGVYVCTCVVHVYVFPSAEVYLRSIVLNKQFIQAIQAKLLEVGLFKQFAICNLLEEKFIEHLANHKDIRCRRDSEKHLAVAGFGKTFGGGGIQKHSAAAGFGKTFGGGGIRKKIRRRRDSEKKLGVGGIRKIKQNFA